MRGFFSDLGVCVLCLAVVCAFPASANPLGGSKVKKSPTASVVAPEISSPQTGSLPLTTPSSEARVLYEDGVHAWETLQTDSALKRWRAATNIDPEFALAHLLVYYCTPDPIEAKTEREKAKTLLPNVTVGERLLITWFTGVRENDYLSGIAAMNDLVRLYPKDKNILVWAGSWLFHQREYDLAQQRLEEASAIDPNFAPPLNDLGYIYAYKKDYEHGFAAMKHYVELMPNEPNPQDSYAEVLRMAGQYKDAIEHYRLALSIDPNFHSSQIGIADTYTLIGDQAKARREYFNARVSAADKMTELQDRMQSAFTYVREWDREGADLAFQGVVQQAHQEGYAMIEAEAWRMRARVQFINTAADLTDVKGSIATKHLGFLPAKDSRPMELQYLAKAEQSVKDAKAISESDRQDELAILLRERAESLGRRGRFAEAEVVLQQLATMANNSPSSAIQAAYNGAQGTVLIYQANYNQAAIFLERDDENAFSQFRLAYARKKQTGTSASGEPLALEFNEPTAEQAFLSLITKPASTNRNRLSIGPR
jgi:tetratricopeptide (TPR) repeat protein